MPPIAITRDEEQIRSKKGIYILGKDIREIPCLRSSLLLGITCGTFAGVFSFMATSKIRMSSHIGFATLWITAFGYWIPCRYKYETMRGIQQVRASEIIQKKFSEHEKNSLVEPVEEKGE